MFNDEYIRLKEIVESNLLEFLPKREKQSETIVESMKYSLEAGGKRIRPCMLIAACKMAGGNPEDAIPFACAIEYIHTYSLIHDDLPAMDDDDLRRGKPTNHVVYGEAEAILAGDALLNRAFEIMLEAIMKADAEKRDGMLKAAFCIGEASGYSGMIGGQISDIESERDQKGGLEMLKFMHSHKTGALLRSAVLAGAYLGGAEGAVLEDLREYAELFGMEFQIADDILDVVGDQKELGKPIGSDEKNGKLTYPSCVGMDEAVKIYEDTHSRALNIIEKYGSDAEFFIKLSGDLYHRVK